MARSRWRLGAVVHERPGVYRLACAHAIDTAMRDAMHTCALLSLLLPMMWTSRRHLVPTSAVQAHACLTSQDAHVHAHPECVMVVRPARRRCSPGCSSSLNLKLHGTTRNAWPLSVCSACKHVALTSGGSSTDPSRHPDQGPGWSTGHSAAAAECESIATDDPQPAPHRHVQHHISAVRSSTPR